MSDEPEEKSALVPNREFIEQIVRRDSERRPAVHEAYEERNRRLGEAWKAPLQATDVWEARDAADPASVALHKAMIVTVHKAMMTYHQTGEIEPLLATLRSPGAMACVDPESLCRLIELLDAGGRPLKAGGPGAYLAKWKNPQMVAALMAEILFAIWRATNGKWQIPPYERDAIVDKVIERMPAYKRRSERGKEDFRDRPRKASQVKNDPPGGS